MPSCRYGVPIVRAMKSHEMLCPYPTLPDCCQGFPVHHVPGVSVYDTYLGTYHYVGM